MAWPASRICSPRPRGWSLPEVRVPGALDLLPAPAGMAPWTRASARFSSAAPRTRGQGPGVRLPPSPS
ncbi:hypothetical protein E4U91_35680 [Streptomyces lasalocidi]|uniref:Uncharacterized protein n=1 Tax=Streptomyces lasalocidi TaxID=324833 RepID=A0A4U5W6A5_STRLS|nr:hypothetical protein E4U91_35680 [Streptomyces lasalocidi]